MRKTSKENHICKARVHQGVCGSMNQIHGQLTRAVESGVAAGRTDGAASAAFALTEGDLEQTSSSVTNLPTQTRTGDRIIYSLRCSF